MFATTLSSRDHCQLKKFGMIPIDPAGLNEVIPPPRTKVWFTRKSPGTFHCAIKSSPTKGDETHDEGRHSFMLLYQALDTCYCAREHWLEWIRCQARVRHKLPHSIKAQRGDDERVRPHPWRRDMKITLLIE